MLNTELLQQEHKLAIVNQIVGKLERAIQKGIVNHAVGGYLTVDEQHAVRILRSRIRLLQRIWCSQYGSGSQQAIAQIELSLKRQDDGTLITLGNRKHSVGRLSCTACENTYESGLPQPLTRLCTSCNGGVQHCIRVPKTEVLEATPTQTPLGEGEGPCRGYKPTGEGIVVTEPVPQMGVRATSTDRLEWICDYCGVTRWQ